ncbi:hypothetical protein B0T16DRAFT_459858 [Cercophora newfieldiana]|uniref:GPI inositol-deacylase n=1 Tax=Cercophora newfieldiana TaxID=92897 RepID=A0AA40CMD9_9PEZI|nr:hypothetical protein B0T16DRAFT_459858 [Cercophora newfieldiana]
MSSLPGNYGLVLRAPSSELVLSSPVQADIVFVHCINGDPSRTWVARDGDGPHDWTADSGFLPTMLPLCRIYTFRWNASVVHYNSDADINNVASALLWQLDLVRQLPEEKHRKLIFVAHSLGGLLVQRALTLDDRVQGRKLIQDSTVGIVFLGTPHGGSQLANIFKRVMFFADSPRPLFDLLSVGSVELNRITTKFKEYSAKRPDLGIVSFGEDLRTKRFHAFRVKVVPLDRARLELENEVFEEAIGKDHHTIARFANPKDVLFLRIVHHLRRFTNKLVPSVAHHPPAQRERIFEIPGCAEKFVGRKKCLAKLHSFLAGSERDKHVAVHGQRGVGKSEIVLRYLLDHGHEYDTVKYFDASSEQILRTQMEGFYDTLGQRNDPSLRKAGITDHNKCDAVLRWFQQEKSCLLVYDNCDAANGFDLHHYIPPPTSPVHRIVIGPNIHNNALSNFDVEVGPMTKEDATNMFITLAALPDLSELDTIYVSQIVEELDRTPFYISFGARYLREMQYGPLQMLQDIHTQKNNMRLKSSQLVMGDGSAMWSIAYERIKRQESSLKLLILFSFLHGLDIRSLLLQRFWTDRTRWNDNGEKEVRTALQDGVDADIIRLFHDRVQFEKALRPLLNATFLQRQQTGSNTSIQIQPLVQQFVIRGLSEEDRLRWLMTVIRLVSHAIPEEPCLEDKNFEVHWSVIINHVFHCLGALQIMGAPPAALADVQGPLVFMLLCSVGRSDKDRGLLSYVDSLIRYRSDIWQRCLATKWRAYFEFNRGDKIGAERLIAVVHEEVSHRTGSAPMTSARNNAAIGDLVLHRAQCLFWQRNYPLAAEILRLWRPIRPDAPSRLEARIHRQLRSAVCKNLVYLGRFDDATRDLEAMLATANPSGPLEELDEFNWAAVTLGELYCKQEKYDQALELIEPRVARFLAENRRLEFISSDFRLILCEALLQTGRYDTFDQQLRGLETDLLHPGQRGKPRVAAQLASVGRLRARSFYLRGRWPQALDAWRRLLLSEGVVEGSILEEGWADVKDGVGLRYSVAEAVISLAVAYWRVDDGERARVYWGIVTSQPSSLVHPAESIDYSDWLDFMKSEFARLEDDFKQQRSRGWLWSWLSRDRPSAQRSAPSETDPEANNNVQGLGLDDGRVGQGRGQVLDYGLLEQDFTTDMARVETYASCPDCENCHCDLKP